MDQTDKARKEHIRGRLAELDAEKQALEGQLFGAGTPAAQPRPPLPVKGGAAIAPVLIGAGIAAVAVVAALGLPPIGFAAGALLVVLGIAAAVTRALLVMPRSDEILVIIGGSRGRRIVPPGGRHLCVPMIEKAERMQVVLPPVDATVSGVYCKDGAGVVAVFTATVRLASAEPRVHHAIERFLGAGPDRAVAVAQQTLEGAIRGVLATITTAEARHDAQRLAQAVIGAAEHDLGKLGIELDDLRITVRDR